MSHTNSDCTNQHTCFASHNSETLNLVADEAASKSLCMCFLYHLCDWCVYEGAVCASGPRMDFILLKLDLGARLPRRYIYVVCIHSRTSYTHTCTHIHLHTHAHSTHTYTPIYTRAHMQTQHFHWSVIFIFCFPLMRQVRSSLRMLWQDGSGVWADWLLRAPRLPLSSLCGMLVWRTSCPPGLPTSLNCSKWELQNICYPKICGRDC